MNNATLAQATLLALTMQNQAFKVAPLSTATREGLCINRNIGQGETVGLVRNTGGSLLRIGDIPSYHSSGFWIGDNNQFYTLLNNRMVVKDGLTGNVIYTGSDNYTMLNIAGDDSCCAYGTPSSGSGIDEWTVILPDGTEVSVEIEQYNHRLGIGYRNGLIGVCSAKNLSTIQVRLYTAAGNLLQTYDYVTHRDTIPYFVIPLNQTTVAVYSDAKYMHIIGSGGGETHDVWDEYSVTANDSSWLGADQSYVYAYAPIYDSEQRITTDEYLTARIPIGETTLEIIADEQEISYLRFGNNRATSRGTVAKAHVVNGETITGLYSLPIADWIYSDVSFTQEGNTIIKENDIYIWISWSGVYMKTPQDWLMYPTSVYPRNDDDQILGYALANYKVGQNGLAIVLFE